MILAAILSVTIRCALVYFIDMDVFKLPDNSYLCVAFVSFIGALKVIVKAIIDGDFNIPKITLGPYLDNYKGALKVIIKGIRDGSFNKAKMPLGSPLDDLNYKPIYKESPFHSSKGSTSYMDSSSTVDNPTVQSGSNLHNADSTGAKGKNNAPSKTD
jgi:hypothetical protein